VRVSPESALRREKTGLSSSSRNPFSLQKESFLAAQVKIEIRPSIVNPTRANQMIGYDWLLSAFIGTN
jgi:hypothetical protein